MEPKMLAEIKSETTDEKLDLLAKQIKDYQKRLRSPTVLHPSNADTPSENTGETVIQGTNTNNIVPTFGWEQIMNGPLLPYVKRGLENFVAHEIVVQKVYKIIRTVFTDEMLLCMAMLMEKMTKEEAAVFNDINITHSDRSIVGDYLFKAGQFMINLNFAKKIVDFFHACKNLVIFRVKENNLFGFIRIQGESVVPFVWNVEQKLVPLFYFEGQSEYLDARSQNLTDPWKIGYLKFCCKVQKLRKDLYEQNPLKVVDFDDVKKLFPADTTFELYLPRIENEDLLALEIRVAVLRGLEDRAQLQETTEDSNQVHLNSNNTLAAQNPILYASKKSKISKNTNNNLLKEKDCDLGTAQGNNKTLQTELGKYKDHMRSNKRKVSDTVQRRPAQCVNNIERKRLRTEMTPTTLQSTAILQEQGSKSNISELASTVAASQPLHYVPRVSGDLIINHVQPEKSIQQQTNLDVNSRRQEQITITPVFRKLHDIYKGRSSLNSHVTNVPHSSPRSASSPGLRQPSPFMNEADQRFSGYTQSTVRPETPAKPLQQSNIPATIYTQPASHMGQNDNLQSNCGNNVQQFYNTQPTVNMLRPNVAAYPVQNRLIDLPSTEYQQSIGQMPSYQIHGYAPTPVMSSVGAVNKVIEKNLPPLTTSHQWQSSYRQLQQQMQHSRCFNCPPNNFNQNFQNVPFGYQPVSGSIPSPSNQTYVHLSSCVMQNVSVATTTHMFNRNQTQTYLPMSVSSAAMQTSYLPSNQNQSQEKYITQQSKSTVVPHPAYMDYDPEFYVVKECSIKGGVLLGISKTPMAHIFLVNLSEFVEKVLGLNPFVTQIPRKFKALYSLNTVQKIQWEKVSKERGVEFVGHFKNLFVECSELC